MSKFVLFLGLAVGEGHDGGTLVDERQLAGHQRRDDLLELAALISLFTLLAYLAFPLLLGGFGEEGDFRGLKWWLFVEGDLGRGKHQRYWLLDSLLFVELKPPSGLTSCKIYASLRNLGGLHSTILVPST